MKQQWNYFVRNRKKEELIVEILTRRTAIIMIHRSEVKLRFYDNKVGQIGVFDTREAMSLELNPRSSSSI